MRNPKRRSIEFETSLRATKRRGLRTIVSRIGFAWPRLHFAFGGEGAFYESLGNHPQIRHELVGNPNVLNEPDYLRDHLRVFG
jgi:hypothetical protein